MIITNPQERMRFIRFAVVGTVGAMVDFGTFNVLTSLVKVPAVWSSVVSFTLAVISNFIWNRYWTYPDSRSKSLPHQVTQFLVVSIIGLGIRTPSFAFLEPHFVGAFSTLSQSFGLPPAFVGHNLALAVVIVVIMFWNFFANRYWTYADID